MKKLLALILITAAAFSSCNNKHEDLYNPEMMNAIKNAQYARAFLQQFGNIDPNHTWGFNNIGGRAVDTNSNQWGEYVEVPAPIAEDEIALVTAWFEQNQNPVSTPAQWSDYFAQQVSSSQYGEKMTYLVDGDGTHLNNFNNGDQSVASNVWNGELTNPDDWNSKVCYNDKILYVKGGSTTSYSCTITCDNNGTCDDFVIVAGELIDPSLAGKFYLGFDFSADNYDGQGKVEADGYYNDWIIKLTPCNYVKSHRIIAEDLGEIGDFDFNDVVFDVYFRDNNAVLTLRAAGGTLPLYITANGKTYEVHELFGVETGVMVNTDSNGSQKPIAIITIENCNSLNQISIQVKQNDGEMITLSAEQGQAPGMICVDTDFEWPAERQNIKEKYPEFQNYVSNQNINWY